MIADADYYVECYRERARNGIGNTSNALYPITSKQLEESLYNLQRAVEFCTLGNPGDQMYMYGHITTDLYVHGTPEKDVIVEAFVCPIWVSSHLAPNGRACGFSVVPNNQSPEQHCPVPLYSEAPAPVQIVVHPNSTG